MRSFLAGIGFIAGTAAVFLALTYPRWHRELKVAKARLLAGSRILKTAHGEIEYSVQGEGVPVLTLHGAGGGYDQGFWAAKLVFPDGYKLVSVSRYGFLRTPLPPNASIRSQATAYKDLLDHLGIQKIVVLGNSAGGPSATQFANDYPERVSALILLSAVSEASATGDKPAFYAGIIHRIQQSDYAYWLMTKFLRPMMLSLVGVPGHVYANFDPAQKQRAQEMLDIMHPMSPRYRGTMNDGEMLQRERVSTDHVSARTLILHAKDDALVSYRHAEHAHKVLRGSRLVLFETGGHAMLSQTDAVRQNVSEYLRLQ